MKTTKPKNIECIESGLICDNPKCNWEDKNIPFKDYEKHLNRKCPKCGENVLTEEDFETVKRLHKTMDFINSLTEKQLDVFSELSGGQEAPGKTEDKKVIMEVKTHKGIKIEIHDA